MAKANHIIRKTTIDISHNGDVNGFLLQEQTSQWWHNELFPALQEELQHIETGTDTLRIDALEISVDANNEENWKTVVLPKILTEIKHSISKHAASAQVNETTTVFFGKTDAIRISNEVNFIALLKTYLSTGNLPWRSSIKNKEEFLAELKMLINSDPGATSESLRNDILALLKQPPSQLRLVYLLSKKEIIDFAGWLSPASEYTIVDEWQKVVDLLIEIYPASVTRINTLESSLLTSLIFNTTGAEILANTTTAIKLLVSEISSRETSLGVALKQQISGYKGVFAAAIANVLSTQSEKKIETYAINTAKLSEIELVRILQQNIEADKSGEKMLATEVAKQLTEGVYVQNAGLVLVVPFLNTLFDKTRITKNFELRDIDSAACLVGYIVTGKTDLAEFDLMLPKLLCGLSMEKEVNTTATLTDEMTTEANDMLASVIEYWPALKNTSIEGLRESFIQREGKLSFKNNEWLLQVEQRAYDMLLQQIPWNYQWIKLPWMPHILKTEWVGLPG